MDYFASTGTREGMTNGVGARDAELQAKWDEVSCPYVRKHVQLRHSTPLV